MATALERRTGQRSGREKVKGKSPTVGEKLLSLKTGAHWTVEELTAIAGNRTQTQEMRSRALIALDDIRIHGDNSLAHLCLEGYVYNSLQRGKVTTISALETAIKDGGLGGIIGTLGMDHISDRLALFHQRLALEQQPKPVKI